MAPICCNALPLHDLPPANSSPYFWIWETAALFAVGKFPYLFSHLKFLIHKLEDYVNLKILANQWKRYHQKHSSNKTLSINNQCESQRWRNAVKTNLESSWIAFYYISIQSTAAPPSQPIWRQTRIFRSNSHRACVRMCWFNTRVNKRSPRQEIQGVHLEKYKEFVFGEIRGVHFERYAWRVHMEKYIVFTTRSPCREIVGVLFEEYTESNVDMNQTIHW